MNSQDVFKTASQFRVPLSCQMEITRFCNFKCKHCYIPAEGHSLMSFKSYLYYLEEIKRAGCRFLTITGGEPLTHPMFSQFYEAAVKFGFAVSVFTNASCLSDDHLAILTKYPPRSIEVSIYGADPITYGKMTGSEVAFADVINNINRLKQAGLHFKLKTFITKDNYENFQSIMDTILMIDDNSGAAVNKAIIYDYKMLPRLDGSDDNLEYRISPSNALQLSLLAFPHSKETWHERIMLPTPLKSGRSECGCGRHSFQISVNGTVSTCTFNTYTSLDLNVIPFKEIWETFGETIKKYDECKKFDSQCDYCKYINVCDICPAISFSEAKVKYRNDAVPYQCEIAKLRYEYALMEA